MKMLNVVIADDDRLVLKDLKCMIDWNALGFSISAMASSGEETLKLLEQHHPFLLITDIRMMGMNGLDVIEIAHEKYPNMKFLIISSYDDFDYVKRAISHGVLDYLLKTEITPVTLTQKLTEARNSFTKDSTSNEAVLEHELELYFNSDEDALDTFPNLHQLTDRRYCFSAIAFKSFFSRDINLTLSHYREQINMLKTTIYQTALEYCTFPILCNYSSFLIVGISFERNKSAIAAVLRDFGSKLNFRLSNTPVPCVQFYMTKKLPLDTFRATLKRLLPLFHYYLNFSHDKPIDMKDLESRHYLPVSSSFSFHTLIFDEEHQEENILKLKAYIEECMTNYDIYSLMRFYQNFCTHLEIQSNNQMQLPFTLNVATPEYFQKWVYNSLHDCIQILTRGLEYEFSPVIDSAVRFMHHSYSKFDLTSGDIADHVGLSANRLGILFKKDTGKTVNEYLNMIRVEKAVELLEKTNMKIYEISEKCGYKSSQYFSQIIYQKTGKRPIDFRKAQR
ncbi:MAG: response regulator [Lachnospiraceae bacterium]|nr:response regulator [Lachnospiraceae bacterium]